MGRIMNMHASICWFGDYKPLYVCQDDPHGGGGGKGYMGSHATVWVDDPRVDPRVQALLHAHV